MFNIPPALGPIPDTTTLGSVLVADLSMVGATWLAVAAALLLALLPIAMRRTKADDAPIHPVARELRHAA